MVSYKMAKMNRIKAWVPEEQQYRTPLVCRRCGKLISDGEPCSPKAEYYHKRREDQPCINDGKTFYLVVETQLPELPNEVEKFESKAARRAGKRALKASKKRRR